MSFLVSFGAALPEHVVTNDELVPLVGRAADWILNVSGISERRWVEPGVTHVDLAVIAAEDCLRRSNFKAADLGMLMVSSGSWGRQFPGPAAQIATRLGIGEKLALDVPLASAGGLVAMALAADLAPIRGPILVVATEIMSEIAKRQPMEGGVAVLFGDGAGACLIHPSHGKAPILGSRLGSDGSFSEDLNLGYGTPLAMNGRSVILQASRKIPRAIKELLHSHGVVPGDVHAFVMHQANQNLMDRIADALQVDRSRFYTNIGRYGNTSSASMLIAAAEWEQKSDTGNCGKVCFAAFGAGYHWGAMLADY